MVPSDPCPKLAARLFMATSFALVALISSVVVAETEREDDRGNVALQVDTDTAASASTEEDDELRVVNRIPQAQADEQRERALKAIQSKGGRVEFEHQLELARGDASLEQLLKMSREDSFVKVRSIHLSAIAVDDDDLRTLVAGLPEVKYLSLSGTSISDAGMEIISELPELTILDLKNTQITGAGLAPLKAHPNLKSLYMDGTRVTDDDLVHLEGLKSLQRLGLNATEITDDGLKHLARLKQLKELRLRDTAITGAGLRFLEGLPNLQVLQLDESLLSNEGQLTLSRMRGLKELVLPPHAEANQPRDWSDLDQLREQLDLRIREALYEEVIGVKVERRP